MPLYNPQMFRLGLDHHGWPIQHRLDYKESGCPSPLPPPLSSPREIFKKILAINYMSTHLCLSPTLKRFAGFSPAFASLLCMLELKCRLIFEMNRHHVSSQRALFLRAILLGVPVSNCPLRSFRIMRKKSQSTYERWNALSMERWYLQRLYWTA